MFVFIKILFGGLSVLVHPAESIVWFLLLIP
jgi:hypothetical protein